MNVDAIQSANVVRVVGDQRGMQPSLPICSLTSQLTRETLIERPTPRSTRVPASSRLQSLPRLQSATTAQAAFARAATAADLCVGPPARLQQLPSIVRPGDAVVVPASLLPAYSCKELGGAVWTATIRRVHRSTARVKPESPSICRADARRSSL